MQSSVSPVLGRSQLGSWTAASWALPVAALAPRKVRRPGSPSPMATRECLGQSPVLFPTGLARLGTKGVCWLCAGAQRGCCETVIWAKPAVPSVSCPQRASAVGLEPCVLSPSRSSGPVPSGLSLPRLSLKSGNFWEGTIFWPVPCLRVSPVSGSLVIQGYLKLNTLAIFGLLLSLFLLFRRDSTAFPSKQACGGLQGC